MQNWNRRAYLEQNKEETYSYMVSRITEFTEPEYPVLRSAYNK